MVTTRLTIEEAERRNLTRLRILVIGINYAPELTGIAPYTTELAQYLASAGHSVKVVTGLPHYPGWRRMPIPHTARAENLIVRRAWHFIPNRAHAFGRMLYEVSFLLSALPLALKDPCDVVLGTVPSLSGGILAVIAGRRYRVPAGLIIKDLIGPAAAQSGYRGGAAVAGLTGRVEGWVIRRAQGVAIISDGFRPYLMKIGLPAENLYKVRDWTHPGIPSESRDACRRRLGWSADEFIALHAGNMGQKQGLDTLLEAASLLRGRIRIVISGDGNDRERLMRRANELRLRNVSFLDLQPPGKYESMLSAADVLILCQRGSVGDMSLPSKLASYFHAGRPVVASVARTSPSALEVESSSGGVVVAPEQPEALAAAISDLATDPGQRHALGAQARRYAESELQASSALRAYEVFVTKLASLAAMRNEQSR